jgi:hypothetical protein
VGFVSPRVIEGSIRWARRICGRDFEETAVSGLVLLASWCLVGGAVGGVIGKYSGRLGVGVVLGSFCGVFGWALLAGAAPRQRVPVASPIPEPVAERPRTDEQLAIANGEQL